MTTSRALNDPPDRRQKDANAPRCRRPGRPFTSVLNGHPRRRATPCPTRPFARKGEDGTSTSGQASRPAARDYLSAPNTPAPVNLSQPADHPPRSGPTNGMGDRVDVGVDVHTGVGVETDTYTDRPSAQHSRSGA